tara:strand:- start:927 stop:1430 length:504 start_codon:yes stop_codon:yes gene_type:complete
MSKNILTLFGIGYLTKFPGTIASLVTCIFFYILFLFFEISDFFLLAIVILTLIFFFSVLTINKFYKNEDSREIVVDEFVGQSIPLLSWYYFSYENQNIFFNLDFFVNYKLEIWIVLSFLLFRIFDIIKPFPISFIDKNIKNGFGVMLDDVLAGVFSTIILYLFFLAI